jgi:Icc protein
MSRGADQMTVTPTFPFTALPPVEVFAVDDRSAQIVWRRLGVGTVIARIDDRIVPLGDAGGPGAAPLAELMPDRDHVVAVSVDDRPISSLRFRTAPSFGDGPSTRIATISDLHFGEQGFGLVKRMNEPRSTPEPYPARCAAAAAAEAQAWGADLIVIKGDITDEGRPEEWYQLDALLDGISVPVVAIPGNHDVVGRHHSADAAEQLRQRGLFPSPVHFVDIGPVRVVAVDSTVPGRNHGRIGRLTADLTAAVDTDRPALVFAHHHLQTTTIPRIWPPGTPRADGYGTLDRLLDANPDIWFSSGHTHRNRSHRHRSAVITEVGSPKDHPGVWAGYEVTAKAIRQTTRRVARPDCITWTERTHAVVGGLWGRWSPGQLDDRCMTLAWSRSGDATGAIEGHQPELGSPIR